MEIAAHRHAFRRRAPKLRQRVAQVHDPVEIVDGAVGGGLVGRRASVLGDVDVLMPQSFTRWRGAQ